MPQIAMPKLSDSMEQGIVLQWLIADGELVEVGDELVEIETEKATMAYQAEVSGALRIIAGPGTTVAVGEPIAIVGEPLAAVGEPDAPRPPFPKEPPTAAPSNDHGRSSALAATPLARRLASAHGIDIGELSGSGPRGRITKSDVLHAAGRPVEQPPTDRPAAAPAPAEGHGRRQELTRRQQVVARRMAEAKATIPHFQVQTEVVVDSALALRAELKAAAPASAAAPSVNDLIVKAAAVALRRHPLANASYKDDALELHDRVNVGVAVAADDALVVATVFDADAKSIGQIAADTRRLAERVRAGTITPPELSGATFTVSNLGMYGMTAIVPVINPPQAAILGVGAARKVLARDDAGEIVDRSLLTLTLSCDHRILYGADAARFLAEIRDLLETPLRLVL